MHRDGKFINLWVIFYSYTLDISYINYKKDKRMEKSIFFLEEVSYFDTAINFFKKNKKHELIFITSSLTIRDKLKELNIQHYFYDRSYDSKKVFNNSRAIIEKINNFKSFGKKFNYRGLSLLELNEYHFAFHLSEVDSYVRYINHILNKFPNSKIFLVKDGQLFFRVLNHSCKDKKLKVGLIKSPLLFRLKYKLRESLKFLRDRLHILIESPFFKVKDPKSIFIISMTRCVTSMGPFIKKLIEKKHLPLVVVPRFSYAVVKELKLNEIKFSLPEYYFLLYINLLMKWKFRKLSKSFTKFKFDNVNLDFSPIPRELVKSEMFPFIKEAFYFSYTVDKILSKTSPNLIVVSDDGALEGKASVLLGKLKGIKSLCIQHAALSDHPSIVPIYSDRFAIYGEETFELLKRYGTTTKSMVITGAPKYDNVIKTPTNEQKSQLYNQLNLGPDSKYFVFCTQPIPQSEKNFRVIIEAAKHFQDHWLIIKLHPGEPTDGLFYKNIAKNNGFDRFKIIKFIDNFILFRFCDLMITQYSTTALEAAIVKTPVIILNLTGNEDWVTYAKKGIAVGSYSKEELLSNMKKIIEDNKFRKRLIESIGKNLNYYVYKLDGHSSERVINLLNKV